MAAPAATADKVSTVRRVSFVVLAALMGVLTGGLGIFIFVATRSAGDERVVHHVHDMTTGLVLVLMFAAGCGAQVASRGRSTAGMQQVMLAAVALLAAAALSGALAPPVAIIAVLASLLAVLHPRRGELLSPRGRLSVPMAAIAGASAAPLAWYVITQAGLQRTAIPGNPHAEEFHYLTMATMGLAIVLIGLLASLRTDGWRVPAWSAGLGAALLGILSVTSPELEGSLGTVGGWLAAALGAAFIMTAEAEARRARED